jgi:hypothetical protein
VGATVKWVTSLGVLVVLAWAMHELVFFHDVSLDPVDD